VSKGVGVRVYDKRPEGEGDENSSSNLFFLLVT